MISGDHHMPDARQLAMLSLAGLLLLTTVGTAVGFPSAPANLQEENSPVKEIIKEMKNKGLWHSNIKDEVKHHLNRMNSLRKSGKGLDLAERYYHIFQIQLEYHNGYTQPNVDSRKTENNKNRKEIIEKHMTLTDKGPKTKIIKAWNASINYYLKYSDEKQKKVNKILNRMQKEKRGDGLSGVERFRSLRLLHGEIQKLGWDLDTLWAAWNNIQLSQEDWRQIELSAYDSINPKIPAPVITHFTIDNKKKDPVETTIKKWKDKNLHWNSLTKKEKIMVRYFLRELQIEKMKEGGGLSDGNQIMEDATGEIKKVFKKHNYNENRHEARMKIIERIFGIDKKILEGKSIKVGWVKDYLKATGDGLIDGAAVQFNNTYELAFNTTPPDNNGALGIFGAPQNKPYKFLYKELLKNKIYPLTNYFLGIGILLLGLSLVVNSFSSRYRVLDLLIKFTTFLLLYTFSWGGITIMHKTVNAIVVWVRPTHTEFEHLVTSIVGLTVMGSIGSYILSGIGIAGTVISVAVELGMRYVLITSLLPYLMPIVLLLYYVSPWQKLRGLASMIFWQYVNLLTMVIPMAIALKAAAIVTENMGDHIVDDPSGVLAEYMILIGLFAVIASIPVISTFFFAQMRGKVSRVGNSLASSAASATSTGAKKTWSGTKKGAVYGAGAGYLSYTGYKNLRSRWGSGSSSGDSGNSGDSGSSGASGSGGNDRSNFEGSSFRPMSEILRRRDQQRDRDDRNTMTPEEMKKAYDIKTAKDLLDQDGNKTNRDTTSAD